MALDTSLINLLCQVAIFIFSPLAIFLASSYRPKVRMIAGIIGLLGQPFWLMGSYLMEQWAIFVMCLIYIFSYVKMIMINNRISKMPNLPISEYSGDGLYTKKL